MKPWIQATWLSAWVTVSAFSHLFHHSCFGFWEPPTWVTLSRWFCCCQVLGVFLERGVFVYESEQMCMRSCGCVSLLPWAPVRRPNRINGLICMRVCACVCVCRAEGFCQCLTIQQQRSVDLLEPHTQPVLFDSGKFSLIWWDLFKRNTSLGSVAR